MKKIILFWLVSTICAAVMYAFSFISQNAADLTFAVGCVAYGIPLVGVFTACLFFGGLDKNSFYENFLFSWLILAVTATVQYITIYKLTTNYSLSLYCGIIAALLCGILLISLGEWLRKSLHQSYKF